ncbi:MAG: EutP/PduV family microcompartment system protein [Ruminococcaceae bacterium]|nr:EutP/PduV family microcompartment system protein [Oscillospiraceae bacterium]
MKKIILLGRVGSGKTTLTQALRGKEIDYHKTQYVHYHSCVIDTPGEYAENRFLGSALALYAYESDVVGLLLSATEPYSLYSPNIVCMANREVIGIVTQIDKPDARPDLAEQWLRLAGCKKIFHVNTLSGEGVKDILDFLQQNQTKSKKKTDKTLTNTQ